MEEAVHHDQRALLEVIVTAPPTDLPNINAHPTDVECPTCNAWVGWACEGEDYGYHAAGYHPSRERAAAEKASIKV